MIENGKAKIEDSFERLAIVIPSKKNWFGLLFGTAWMGGWYFGLKSALGMFSNGKIGGFAANGFMSFWLIGWSIGGLAIVSFLLWGYFGKEKIIAEGDEVVLKKTVFGIGWRKRMEAGEIKNIRLEPGNANWFGNNRLAFWGLGPGKIKFDYGFKTLSFGLGVDDAEANYIIELMKTRFKN